MKLFNSSLILLILLVIPISYSDDFPYNNIDGLGIRYMKGMTYVNATQDICVNSTCLTESTGGSVTSVSGDGTYVTGTITTSGTFGFNETNLNSTIDARAGTGGNTSQEIRDAVNITSFYQIFVDWVRVNNRPTVLSDFTDDLGDRGYNDLDNFTNSPGYVTNSTADFTTGSDVDGWVGNWTDDKVDYYTSAEVNALNNSWNYTVDTFNTTTQIQEAINTTAIYQISVLWNNIIGRLTNLSQFTDDLGNRGYDSLSNFSNDIGYITNSTANFTVNSDTNASTACNGEEVLNGDGFCVVNYNTTIQMQIAAIGLNGTWDALTLNGQLASFYYTASNPNSYTDDTTANTKAAPGNCGAGEFVQNSTISGVECTAAGGSGTVTSITFENGLTGGTITTSGTATLNTTYTSIRYVNRSDWTTNDDYPTTCGAGKYVQTIGDTLTCVSVNNGTVTTVTGASPITSTGGVTPEIALTLAKDIVTTAPITGGENNVLPGADADLTISMSQSDTNTDGYLSQTDWDTFNNKGSGTVTSVATDDTYLTGGAITSTGTITFNTTLAGTSLAVNSSDYWDDLGSPTDITSLGTIGSATSITSTAFVGPLTGSASAWITMISLQAKWFADVGNVLTFDETELNTTIDARDTDTTYTASGTLLDLAGTVFSLDEGTLTDERVCEYESTGTQLECNTIKDVSGSCASGSLCTGANTYVASSITAGSFSAGNYVFSGGTLDADTLNTGQGDNELYDMDQNVLQASDVTFNNISASSNVNVDDNLYVGSGRIYDNGTHLIID